jgi:hypothetical protein
MGALQPVRMQGDPVPPVAPDVGVPPMLAAPQGIPVPRGPAPGMLMRAPGSYTPGGMRQDSAEAVRTPGAAAAIDRAEALYGAAGELDMAAQRELAATADAQAAAQETAAQQERQLQAELESRERARAARIDKEAQAYLDTAKATQLERPSLASARGEVGYPQLALLTIAQGILGANAGASGREPPDLVGAAIQRQLADQRSRYEIQKEKAGEARGAYAQLRAMGADAREADLAYSARVRGEAVQTLQQQIGRITDPAKRAAAAAELARQQAKQAAAMAELRGKVGDKVTEREKYQAARSSGGGYMVATAMPDGTTQYLPIAIHKQYTEAMGQDPGQRLKSAELGLKYGAEGLSGRKLAAETARAEAEARKATTGEDPEKEAEKASANVAALASIRDLRAKMEAAGWKFGPKGVEREGKELPGLGVSSPMLPDVARRVTGAVGATPTVGETAETQGLAQSALNQYLKSLTGAGVTASDIPRLETETGTQMGGAGNVVGTRDPKAFANWVLRAQRGLEAQQNRFSPAAQKQVAAEQAKLDRAINGGK